MVQTVLQLREKINYILSVEKFLNPELNCQ